MNLPVRPPLYPFPVDVAPEVLRKAIDRVTTLRARVIRVGLFGNLLYRPDPASIHTEQDRLRHRDILHAEVKLIVSVVSTLRAGTDLPDTPPCVTRWFHGIATLEPEKLARVVRVANLSKAIVDALDTCPKRLGEAIEAHMVEARSGFFELITDLCDALWDAIADHQRVELEKATAAATALATRLNRLEHIGKHVRLVSLNASVEAARAGDVGKGLMVIAQEFKVLAEEIQTLAKDAHGDMAAFS